MSPFSLIYSICLYLSFSILTSAAIAPAYRVRNAPGASTWDTYQAVRRAFSEVAVQKREVELKNSTSLDRSWDDAVLLKFEHEQQLSQNNRSSLSATAGIEIVCTQCYIKGTATVELTIDDNFNASQVLSETLDQVRGNVENFTESLDDYFFNYVKGVADNFDDGIDIADFAFPTFNASFDLDIPAIPECNLRFQFDGMELYMNMNTILSLGSIYELSLYRSNTPLGISITKDLEVGIIFAVDLILSVEGEVDISSGFHIKLEDGAAIDIKLFADDISDIVFNGARFEFLPVTVQSAGVVFSATLRVGVHAGFQLVSPSIPEFTLFDRTVALDSVGGGIEVGVFANVAEFITNVTFAPEEDCKLQVVQSYQLALGAAAGATIAIGDNTWGPMATTSVPIFYTEIGELCAAQKTASATPTITPTPAVRPRQDLTTTTVTTKVTYTGVSCMTPGLVNCPASAQSTTQSVETRTITTAIPSGADFTVPATAQNVVTKSVDFGSNAVSVPKTSGSPVSYVPPPPKETAQDEEDSDNDGESQSNIPETIEGKTGGVSNKLIIGLSVGLGAPFLIALLAGISFFIRHRNRQTSPKFKPVPTFAETYGPTDTRGYMQKPVKSFVAVREVDLGR
ncbi:uncharacterized protein EI97DRAFT_390529 [Westerdykella ornata]|uniref:Mid2 domain-containing protein n=1 Tax=Westerdykella ornata TaxID=318751 RepID=A0A6A6JUI7_WESOR|nr:uncharacterized protein EI97DRAFT_390529 [Westerdykella ornata]KAF2279884.1 hypothetical protein EI97DRAFT_390529 [Westerdykella ornata]